MKQHIVGKIDNMHDVIESISTREMALLIWILIVITVTMISKHSRHSILGIVTAFFNHKHMAIWASFALIILFVTILFARLSFWHNSFIKDIIIWFVTAGIVYCFNAISMDTNNKSISKVLKENLSIVVIIEFLTELKTFGLIIELTIVPIFSFLSLLFYVSKKEQRNYKVSNFLEVIINVAIGLFLFATVKLWFCNDESINSQQSVVSFFIPIVYTILSLPIYVLYKVIARYNTLFNRTLFKEGNGREFKLRIIRLCGLSIEKIKIFSERYLYKITKRITHDEMAELLNEFEKEIKQEKI